MAPTRRIPALVLMLTALFVPELSANQQQVCNRMSLESIATSLDGSILYIADRTGCQVLAIAQTTGQIQDKVSLPGEPAGLAVSPNGKTLYATCNGSVNALIVIDLQHFTVEKTIAAGAGACCPVVHPSGKYVYVLARFANQIVVIDTHRSEVIDKIDAGREPAAAAITPDGTTLVVTNHLPDGPSNRVVISGGIQLEKTNGAAVRSIDTQSLKTISILSLKTGSQSLNGVCVSPDGRYAFVTHILSRFQWPAELLQNGWMNGNALAIIDLKTQTLFNTVLLDSPERGAANPWGLACSANGHRLLVAHAGTHELSVIDLPKLLERLRSLPEYTSAYPGGSYRYGARARSQSGVSEDLNFIGAFRRRVKLNGLGPRAVAVVGDHAYVTHFFSGSFDRLDLSVKGTIEPIPFRLVPEEEPSLERRGEFLFNDASICFQGWQSCASCHPGCRSDGLNWDLLNDGTGNAKNTKSLLLSHQTPPAMSEGVRPSAEIAVRSGLKHILYLENNEREAQAIDAYLKSLKPVPGVTLMGARQRAAAKRGEQLFYSPETGCASCHNGAYFTDLSCFDVGTKGPLDRRDDFDTPTLVELWRSAPYLHDGRAISLKEVLTVCNTEDRHGQTTQLTETQLDDLVAYLLSL